MVNNTHYTKILCELIVGMISGTLLGIFSFLALITYGGNYGCFYVIDKVFGLQGYESCGLFGLLLGILTGSLLSIFLLHRSKFQKESYEKIIALGFVFVIVIPLIVASVIGLPFNDIPSYLIRFLGFSFIPSLLATLLANWKIFSKKTNP